MIAILAVITIAAYNGIQSRAHTAAASSGASQAARKLALYLVDNGTYPSQLSTVGVNDGGTTYQYSVNNSVSPPTYCVTATDGDKSSFVSNAQTTPTTGACPGHGSGGVGAITNLATDPRATSYSLSAGSFGWRTARWFGGSGGAGAYSLITGASDGPLGISTYARKTWSAAPASIGNSGDTGFESTASYGATALAVNTGDTYFLSCYLRPSINRNFNMSVYQYNPDGTAFSSPRNGGPQVAGPANTWTRVTYSYVVPSGVGRIGFVCDSTSSTANSAANWAAGATLDGTGLMMVKTSSTLNYADGDSPNWVWNGTANNSTSTGSPL